MKRILIFGGTEDGRELAETLSKTQDVTLSVATKFGKDLIEDDDINVIEGRLEAKEIQKLTLDFDAVIDATHPYAVLVSKNIKEACGTIPLYRLVRDESELEGVTVAENIKDACDKCGWGNILAATGSKQIKEYTDLDRVYARVLPTEESIRLCLEAGLKEDHIIESFGRTGIAENMEVIKKYNIKNLITKDSGARGGFAEKKEAAKRMGIRFIVIKRPKEEGYSAEELIDILGGQV